MCRDYAHLVVALARAVGMPARYVSVYAPGLSPMDAHAVVEIGVDGRWFVFDATRLAPRRSMVRIGTGRDAADVAILSSLGGVSGPTYFEVTATASPVLPDEDPDDLVTLGSSRRPLESTLGERTRASDLEGGRQGAGAVVDVGRPGHTWCLGACPRRARCATRRARR